MEFRYYGISILAMVVAGPLLASEGDIKYREHTMESIGGHMGAIVDIIRRDVAHTSHLPIHANALADLAGIVPSVFPEGSGGGDTEALPEIWTQPEDFANRLETFKQAASALKAAAASGDGVGSAVQNVGQACKGCHDNYRAE